MNLNSMHQQRALIYHDFTINEEKIKVVAAHSFFLSVFFRLFVHFQQHQYQSPTRYINGTRRVPFGFTFPKYIFKLLLSSCLHVIYFCFLLATFQFFLSWQDFEQ
jgi:hypothetical protein